MKKLLIPTLILSLVIVLTGLSWPFSWIATNAVTAPPGSTSWISQEMQQLKSQAGNIDERVLRLSLIAYLNARKNGYVGRPLITVIDYSKPSSERRLWVFDLRSNRTLFNTWVSHGKNSGGASANSFSNSQGSLKSSIGVFMTAEPYMGGNGYSLRLRGLEPGINDNAYRRDIVIHGASYVNPDIIRTRGQVGRSWGCPAVSANLSRPLINTIKERTLVVAYYPDRSWLSNSRFLAG